MGGLVLVEGVVRLPFATRRAKARSHLLTLAQQVFRLYPGLEGSLFETYNWVTETDLANGLTGYRVVYGLDYFDFETDRSRVLQPPLAVRSAEEAGRFELGELDQSTLSLALERTYDEGSDVRVNHVINRILVIRGVYDDGEHEGRGRIVSLA